jgi:hypothetical protein
VRVLELKAPDHAVVGRFDERGQDAKCSPAEHKTAPSGKREAAVELTETIVAVWFRVGAGGLEPPKLVRVKQIQAWTALDYTGHSSGILDLRGPSRTRWDSQPSQNRPKN